MKTKLYISILFCLVAVSSWAQTFKNTYTPSATPQEYEAFKSPQIMQTSAHEGTIYEPFSSATPSDQSAVAEGQNSAGRPGQIRRGFDTGAETGQSTEFPLGDAMLPLMLMGIAFAMFVYFRRKQTLKG